MKVAEVSSKMQEKRLNWYGNVMGRSESYIGRRVMEMVGPRHRGRERPKYGWKDKQKDV